MKPVGYIDEYGNFEPVLLQWMIEEPNTEWKVVYLEPPNDKAIRAAALMEAVELIKGHAEAHSSKVGWHLVSRLDGDIRGLAYADAIQSLIDAAPTRGDE